MDEEVELSDHVRDFIREQNDGSGVPFNRIFDHFKKYSDDQLSEAVNDLLLDCSVFERPCGSYHTID